MLKHASPLQEGVSRRESSAIPIYVLAVLGAAMSTAEVLSGSMMPLIATGLRTSEGMVGQAVTATAIMAIITSLSIGKISGDRDRRKLLIALTSFLVISNLGVALAPNIWFMLGARLFLGVSIGVVWGLIPAVVLRLAPPGGFSRSFSTVMVGVATSVVIAAPLSAYIGALLSWRVVYLAATALAALAMLLLVVAFPPLPAQAGRFDRNLGATLRLPGLMIGMAGIMLLFGGVQAFFGYLVPFLEDITGLGPTAVSLTLLALGISSLIGTLVAPRQMDISIYRVLVVSAAVMAITLGASLMVATAVIPVVMVFVIWSFARAHLGMGVNAWIAFSFPDHVEGAGGILVAVIQGAMMLGAILGGVLIDTADARAPVAAGGIILAIAAVYGAWALRPVPTSRDAAPSTEEPMIVATDQVVVPD